jgi:hypothetical protein
MHFHTFGVSYTLKSTKIKFKWKHCKGFIYIYKLMMKKYKDICVTSHRLDVQDSILDGDSNFPLCYHIQNSSVSTHLLNQQKMRALSLRIKTLGWGGASHSCNARVLDNTLYLHAPIYHHGMLLRGTRGTIIFTSLLYSIFTTRLMIKYELFCVAHQIWQINHIWKFVSLQDDKINVK